MQNFLKFPAVKYAIIILIIFSIFEFIFTYFQIELLTVKKIYVFLIVFIFINILEFLWIEQSHFKYKSILVFIIFVSAISLIYLQNKLNFLSEINRKFNESNDISATVILINPNKYFILDDLIINNQKYNFKLIVFQKNFKLKYFDRIKLTSAVIPLDFSSNFDLYNFEEYLYYNKIFFCCRNCTGLSIAPSAKLIFFHSIKKKIYDRFSNNRVDDFVKGMLLGDKNDIDKITIQNFKYAGISHILAISGLNIGFITAMFYYFANLVKLNKLISVILITIILIFYLILLEWSVTVFRAVVMSLLILWAEPFQRKTAIANIIAVAFIIITLLNPVELFTPGFQLSFGAVIAIFYLYLPVERKIKNKKIKFIVSPLLLSIIIILATAPITIYKFNFLSLHCIWTNIVAVPVSALMMPLSIFYLFFIFVSDLFSYPFYLLLNLCAIILEKVSAISAQYSFLTYEIPSFNLFIIAIYYTVLFMIFYFDKTYYKKYFTILLILIFIFSASLSLRSRILTIQFIDSDDNEVYIINHYGKYFLVLDKISSYTQIKPIIKQFILKNTLFKFDYIICNTTDILELDFKKFSRNNLNSDLTIQNFNSILSIDKFDNQFTVFINEKNFSFLSLSNIELKKQIEIIKNNIDNFKNITFLKLSDNGSLLYNSVELINKIEPLHLICFAGKNNRYNLPAADLIKNFNKEKIFVTKNSGGIKIIYFNFGKFSKYFLLLRNSA